MLEKLDYRECLKKADAYKAIGNTKIYLYDGSVFPWEHVTKVEPGGMVRMNMAVSVQFVADIDGLQFTWSWDLEDRDANGKGHYEVDTAGCRAVLARLPPDARVKFREYLADCAVTVAAKGNEWQEIADRQKRHADALQSLATISE